MKFAVIFSFAGYLKNAGADIVLDMTLSEDLSLLEAENEFIERFRSQKDGTKPTLPMLTSSCPGEEYYEDIF